MIRNVKSKSFCWYHYKPLERNMECYDKEDEDKHERLMKEQDKHEK